MKKLFISLFTLAFAALLLVGCTDDPSKKGVLVDFSESLQKKVEITVWMDDDKGEYMAELIDAFQKQNTNILVKFNHMGTVDAREKLKLYGPSGHGADIFQFPHDHLAQAVLEDLVRPISSNLQQRVSDRILPVALDIATICYNPGTKSFDCAGGALRELYAMPNSIESVVMFYNPNITDAPETFEQIIAEADSWKAAHNNAVLANSSHWADSYFMQFMFSAFDWRPFGATGSDPSKVGYELQSMQNALAWFRSDLQKAAKYNSSTSHDAAAKTADFISGNSKYLITGPWTINELQDAKVADPTFDFAATPMPTINGVQPKTFAGAQMSAIYKNTQHPAEAEKFLEFLASDQAMEILYRHKNKLPALKPELIADIEGLGTDQVLQAISTQLETAIPMPTIPQVTYYWGPAETMLRAIWSDTNIAEAVKAAEDGYLATANLAN